MIDDVLELLNEEQRRAVLHNYGSLLILAGAGSGKTRVITVKIAWSIEKQNMDPRSILAVTFTNKAAREMRERAESLSASAEKVVIRTFHSFGAWLLRRNSRLLDLSDTFTIYDDDDSIALLAHLYPDQPRNHIRKWAQLISRAKDNCIAPNGELSLISSDPELPEVYDTYEKRLRDIGNVDFGDLILRPIELLQNEPIIAERIRERFSVIFVDEYQDSNVAQYNLLRELYGKNSSICVVGDDDQSIYRFRGAEVRNILDFPRQFGNADIIKLEENYRSTNPILRLAGNVVRRNRERLGKNLWTRREGGNLPVVARLSNQNAEIDYITRIIRDTTPGEIAILFRTNAQSRPFEAHFLREEIPYKIIGTLRFHEREEVKDAIALLKLMVNPKDEVSFTRIVNKPARGVGPATIEKVLAYAPSLSGNFIQASERAASILSGKSALGLSAFARLMLRAESLCEETQGHLGNFIEKLLEQSGLPEFYMERDEIAGTARLQNLEELINAASIYMSTGSGLSAFLESWELEGAREQNDIDAQVTLITMHNTKGLEFDRVIITGLEDGIFPRDKNTEELEDERRLFYVAITRARNELHITCCASRRVHGRMKFLEPSIFINEIDDELIEYFGNTPDIQQSLDDPWSQWTTASVSENTGGMSVGEKNAGCEYSPGQLVYHDDYGSGEVIKSSYNGTDEIIHVRFESGRTGQFLPRYSPIEKISSD